MQASELFSAMRTASQRNDEADTLTSTVAWRHPESIFSRNTIDPD